MKNHGIFRSPEHGLQLEETIAAKDFEGAAALFRYWYAWQLAHKAVPPSCVGMEGYRVLDAGCGCGYGARILIEIENAHVTAIDNNRDALNMARSDYGGHPDYSGDHDDRISFESADLEPADFIGWPYKFDMICCFEVLELLRHREVFLERYTSTLNPGGLFVLSADYSGMFNPTPTDAYVHYDKHHLEQLLRRYFNYVRFSADHSSGVDPMQSHYRQLAEKAGCPPEQLPGRNIVICNSPINLKENNHG